MYLLFDIGGTHMRIAVSSDGQTLTNSKIISTPQDFNQGIQSIKQTTDQLLNGGEITAIAGALAGPLSQDKTMLINGPQIPDWVGKNLKEELERVFNSSVKLENDANLEGLGEAIFGAGKDYQIVSYITIGTGVGGSRIVDGRLEKNAYGFEPGHQIIIPEGNLCNCGGKGHLEAYIGGISLEKIYHQKGEDIKDPAVWDQAAKYLSLGLHNTVVHWSPDIIVIGGSVSQSIPLDKVKVYLKNYLTIFPNIPVLAKAELGNKAGLLGALALLTTDPSTLPRLVRDRSG